MPFCATCAETVNRKVFVYGHTGFHGYSTVNEAESKKFCEADPGTIGSSAGLMRASVIFCVAALAQAATPNRVSLQFYGEAL